MKNFIAKNFMFILYCTMLLVVTVVVKCYVIPKTVDKTLEYVFDESMKSANLYKDSAIIMRDSAVYYHTIDSIKDYKRCTNQFYIYKGQGLGCIELFNKHKK